MQVRLRRRLSLDQPTKLWSKETRVRLLVKDNIKREFCRKLLTCCLNDILSEEFFFAKLDKNDKGNTNAALPTKIRPTNIELTATDVPGLKEK